MSKKLTYEFVKTSFNLANYVLLSKEYINAFSKLQYICINGHKHSISWAHWSQGHRCPFCAGLVKHQIGFIRKEFKKEGYTLLSKEYINARTKLEYRCPKGHMHSIAWYHWTNGKRCPYCAGLIRLTINNVKSSLEKEGYVLLSDKYQNAFTKLEYTCPDGHENSTTWNSWQRGCRCPTCAKINSFGPNAPNWKGGISCAPYCQDWTKEYKDFIKERDGYKCLNPDCWCRDGRLHVHHIDYNKKNCGPNNLITLCGSCNARANKDRKWHKAWYQAIIKNRYLGVSNG